jgi:hypothetical protein
MKEIKHFHRLVHNQTNKIKGLKDLRLVDQETTRKLEEAEEYYRAFVKKVSNTKASDRWKYFRQKAEMTDDEGRNYRISQEMARNIMSIVELGYNVKDPKEEEGTREGNNAIFRTEHVHFKRCAVIQDINPAMERAIYILNSKISSILLTTPCGWIVLNKVEIFEHWTIKMAERRN